MYLFHLLMILLLAGCGLVFVNPTTSMAETPITAVPTAAVTAEPTAQATIYLPTISVSEIPYEQCAWQWASQDLPEITAQLAAAYQSAGLPAVEARAMAFGENCLGPEGQPVRFAAMQTDIYLAVPVTDLQDTASLGNLAAQLLAVLEDFPVSSLVGPNPGYIGIRYRNDAGEQNLWFPRTKAEALLAQGLTGSDLYEALRNP